MGALKRWQEYARQYGYAGLVRHIAARLLRPVWETAATQILVLEPPVAGRSARVPLEVRVLSRSEALAAHLLHPDWDRRWSRGDICYGGWVNGVCVHHSWVTTRDTLIGEVHGQIRVAPDEAYVYDCFTSADCRGQGIFPAVLVHIGNALVGGGAARIWIAVEDENRSSIKAIERAGFQLAGEITYRRFAGSPQVSVRHESNQPSFGFASESAG